MTKECRHLRKLILKRTDRVTIWKCKRCGTMRVEGRTAKPYQ